MEKLLEIFCSIAGTLMIVFALDGLIPNGMYLHLVALVLGVQFVAMAFRSVLKSDYIKSRR
tara:strand:+ start:317 stop:499 length:183 start_codon:yes stop_codon:yes gene_type:complete